MPQSDSALPQKGHQHWNAPAVWSVGLRTEFTRQETFFHAGLLPKPGRNQHCAEQCRDRPNRDPGREDGSDEARIDRVAHKAVWTGIDDAVAFLACDGARPKASKMNARPPGEQGARQGQARKHVCCAVAELPERLLSQHLRGPRREQYGARNERNSVGSRVPGPDLFFCSTGKERAY